MPIFEYSCSGCGTRFERIVFRGDETITCPECGAHDVTREVSTFAFSSGGRFTSSSARGASCAGCRPGPGGCSGCGH